MREMKGNNKNTSLMQGDSEKKAMIRSRRKLSENLFGEVLICMCLNPLSKKSFLRHINFNKHFLYDDFF